MRELCDYIKEGYKYFIYGTAMFGRFCCEKVCERLGDEAVIGYIETKPTLNPFDGGKRIYSPEEAAEVADENTYIILTGRTSSEAMRRRCIEVGIADEKVFYPNELIKYLSIGYPAQVKSVCVWPCIHDFNLDLLEKISWYIPEKIKVRIWTDNEEMRQSVRNNVTVCSDAITDQMMLDSDYILIWDVQREDELFERYPGKCRIIDPNFFEHIDTYNYDHILISAYSTEERKALLEESKEVFCEFQKTGGLKKGNVFCSGPSISEVYRMPEDFFDGQYNIICNSMVKDKELCSRLNPKAITFVDTNFFFSPSEYGRAFYNDLLEAYEKYNFYIFVRDSQKVLLCSHFPELRERVIGLPYSGHPYYWFPSAEHFEIKSLANILTELMIPIASVICDEIGIAGCTGRNPEETYFWEHNERTQYLDLKESVFRMWPAFFKYRRYGAYYDRHCQTVEELLEYGESLGKTYVNITTSYIPALKKRSWNKGEY